MATIPVTWTVGEFTAGVEDWESFVERVEFFFQANGVEDPERKRALLLSSCGTSTYKLIRNLLVPSKPEVSLTRTLSIAFVPIINLHHPHLWNDLNSTLELGNRPKLFRLSFVNFENCHNDVLLRTWTKC